MFKEFDYDMKLSDDDAELIHEIIGDRQFIADLSFSDVVLWMPDSKGQYVAVVNARPSNGQTLFHTDIIGRPLYYEFIDDVERAVAERAAREVVSEFNGAVVKIIPIFSRSFPTEVIAVVTSHQLRGKSFFPMTESNYRRSAEDIFKMMVQGTWPDCTYGSGSKSGEPRVCDGMMRLDRYGSIEYASPNGVSSMRRLGYWGVLEGQSLAKAVSSSLTRQCDVDDILRLILLGRIPYRSELRSRSVALTWRSIPLYENSEHVGAIILCRDVSELRRREAELVSKDAMIREIHHRVKNNLQTVASLLRMQSRRMHSAEGREGLQQAMQRVSTIASVHDTLSQGLAQQVNFDDLVSQQIRQVVEIFTSEQPVRTSLEGTFGELPSKLATPLALVINELLMNAIEHGFQGAGRDNFSKDRKIVIEVRRFFSAEQEAKMLEASVIDNGRGFPSGDFEEGLGLSIVKTLVNSDLKGTIKWQDSDRGGIGEGNGTRVRIIFPVEWSD